ncbi:MAG: hypothetical protein AAB250_05575 [Bdellovibrionota bacterium]
MFKKAITLAVATASLATLPACTDTQIAASALVIGAAVVCDWDCGPRYDRPHHRHGRHRHHVPHRHGHRWSSGAGLEFVSTDARVIALANNYDVSHYAATYLVRAVALAQAKDTSGIKALGLDVSDFKDIMDGDEIEASKVNALSLRLLMSKSETERLIGEMSEDIQLEKAARNL